MTIQALYDDVYREVAKATRGDRNPNIIDREVKLTIRKKEGQWGRLGCERAEASCVVTTVVR